ENLMKEEVKACSSQDQSHQRDASPQDTGRREFIGKSIGAAVLGAAVIGGAGSAMAQDMVIPTTDWKTVEPGPRANDLYAEQSGFNDADTTWWPGRNISGVTIGLIQFQANLPMIPGNMGNATTFDFPMLYREMNAENVLDVMSTTPVQQFTDACVEAAQWLEMQGVRAIMGNCGFFGHYQIAVQERINTPFFSSSLMMLPMMVRSMPRNQKVGVLTANGPLLREGPAMENCGLSPEDKKNRVVVEGCEDDIEFARAMAVQGAYNPVKFEQDVLTGIKRLLKKDPDIGVILLECTELSPHAHAVQRLVNMPVWDYTSLTNWIYSGTVRRPFVGHV
ncbi:MAG: hypothetical protein N2C12_01185, partial [Planctomycetales bacterium]